MKDLTTRAIVSLAVVIGIMGLILFAGAGTFHYWQAWAFLAIYLLASLVIASYLVKNDPVLMERRMRGGPAAEKETSQKIIMSIVSGAFIATLVVPALDHRFGWSHAPIAVDIAGDLLMIISFYSMFVVIKENSFASATVEIAANQKVISTGPYAIVRHPMYAGGSLLFLGIPLALGSYWGLLALAIAAPFLLWRLFDEERLLTKELPGYVDYCARVRWRLVPGVF